MKSVTSMMLLLVSIAVGSCFVYAGDGPKVLLNLRQGTTENMDLENILSNEVGVMIRLLKGKGYEVVVATTSGQPVGVLHPLQPDLKLADVKVIDYAGIIMPCMGSGAVDSEAVEIVKQAVAMGKPLAAQSGAIRTLAEAGVLKGRNYAFPYDPLNLHLQPRDAKFEGAIYKKDIIVKDGKIITSCCSPSTESAWFSQDATVELTRALIDELIPK